MTHLKQTDSLVISNLPPTLNLPLCTDFNCRLPARVVHPVRSRSRWWNAVGRDVGGGTQFGHMA